MSSSQSNGILTPGAKAAVQSLQHSEPSFLSKLNPWNWEMFNKAQIAQQRDDEAYQAGEPYADPEVVSTGLAEDLKAIGLTAAPKSLEALINTIKSKGKPIHDRELTMEKMLALIASLPRTSLTRKKLTGVVIDQLWSSLQHPPLSYLGDRFQYRTPDGSYNNPHQPDLGKAGTPYARSIKKMKQLKGSLPDPGLLFDLLQARTPESFKENPAGLSSMLFYHATIIIHDIFRTNRYDNRISDTSSYLDLAPLYGSNLEDQLSVRTMSKGLLKPDCFAEKRLIGQPPGVNCLLVMYSRFHNYVAETLLKINEYDRFAIPPTSSDEQLKKATTKQDEDLFQTARLITNGLYIQICLHDYLRGITNAHHSKSDWTLDPRVDVDRTFDASGVPKGVGNQVSCEFNLLYRFHSTISLRDEKWTNDFLKTLLPDTTKSFEDVSPQEFIMALFKFEASIPAEPEKREFGGLKRDPKTGKFHDADMVKILTESMEDPAGLFGARMIPKALKMIEVAGTLTARKWQVGSLNEMRAFFGLAKHETFEDINPDQEIADLLRQLYQDPDMVEMYPGMFLEDAKPRMDPGCGFCPPYTVGRAVLSDAVTLVRSDRFLTTDYTAAVLTNWGIEEVERDLDVLGGSMFYKLFHRALPGWYPYNSLHIMQPMYTRKMNEQIAREIGTIGKYTLDGPATSLPTFELVTNRDTVIAILKDSDHFKVPHGQHFKDMFDGKRDWHSFFMLGGDSPAQLAQGRRIKEILYAAPTALAKLIHDSTVSWTEQRLQTYTMTLKKDLLQFDVLRDITIPVLTRVLSDLFCLDLRSSDNPKGSLNATQVYRHLSNVRDWGFNDLDVALSWKRRMWAEKSADALTKSTALSINEALGLVGGTIFAKLGHNNAAFPANASLRWFGQHFVKEMAEDGESRAHINEILWLSALGGVGSTTTLVADCLTTFLKPENADIWSKIQDLAANKSGSVNQTIMKYVKEAVRLTNAQRDVRVCTSNITVKDKTFKPGDKVVMLLGPASRLPPVEDPGSFKLDRGEDDYLMFGYGPHHCLGKHVALTFVTSIIEVFASMKNLRPAPGSMGILHSVMMGQAGTDKYYLNDSWSYLTSEPSTWTLHFDGYGKGVYKPDPNAGAGQNLDALFASLRSEHIDQGDLSAKNIAAADGKNLTATPVLNGSAN